MADYVLVMRESSNRVYDGNGARLLAAELAAMRDGFAAGIETIELLVPDDPFDVALSTAADLTDGDLRHLAEVSALRLAFRRHDDLLELLPGAPPREHDEDLVTIQRYRGKTNEAFTHLLVNLTRHASVAADRRLAAGHRIALLDPVAGRGTTLNRGLTLGYDVAGIEKSETEVTEYRTFLSTYWKDHRVKHKLQRERIRKGPQAGTNRFTIQLGSGQRIDVVQADTAAAPELFPGRKFDLIVGDLPYGVQHRATQAEGVERSAAKLLAGALPGWRRALHRGGAIGLAWNLRTLPRSEVITMLRDHGFTVVDHPRSFEHVVDRSITRDLVVAQR